MPLDKDVARAIAETIVTKRDPDADDHPFKIWQTDAEGFVARRVTADDRLIALVPLTFQRLRVTAGRPGDRGTWEHAY